MVRTVLLFSARPLAAIMVEKVKGAAMPEPDLMNAC
jgi:hypothetical protein